MRWSRWSGSRLRLPPPAPLLALMRAYPARRWPWPGTVICHERSLAVHPRFAVPHRAEVAVGLVVAAVAAVADVRAVIGFSSFAVLVYYAIANASAATLAPGEGRPLRVVTAVGLVGCIVLALALPGCWWLPASPCWPWVRPYSRSGTE